MLDRTRLAAVLQQDGLALQTRLAQLQTLSADLPVQAVESSARRFSRILLRRGRMADEMGQSGGFDACRTALEKLPPTQDVEVRYHFVDSDVEGSFWAVILDHATPIGLFWLLMPT
jgi:hypothetical protein